MTDTIVVNTIIGCVESYLHHNPSDNYSILRLRQNGKQNLTTAVGHLPLLPIGAQLELLGTWTRDLRFGEQFKATSYQVTVPDSVAGIEKYLGSGLVKGIGQSFAKKIVAAFGTDTASIIENHSERLCEIPGLGGKRIESIRKSWIEQKDIQQVMIYLQGLGISSSYATRIYREYGRDSVTVIKENPYRLAEGHQNGGVLGISFKIADTIALSLGFDKESIHRVSSGVIYALNRSMSSGHSYVPLPTLVNNAAKILGIGPEFVSEAIPSLANDGKIVIEHGDRVYLVHVHAAELRVAELIKEDLAAPVILPELELRETTRELEESMGIQLTTEQKTALEVFYNNHITVWTGSPGVGKTLALKFLAAILTRKNVPIALAAPTGRAARRMSEVSGIEATTIHKLLEFDPKTWTFLRNSTNKLPIDVLIVDEASMLDIHLCRSLLEACSIWTAILFIGDVDQLPAIGSGDVLNDLIKSGVVPVVRLTKVFRQGEGSLININAQRINSGKPLDLRPNYDGLKDMYFIQREAQESILDEVVSLVTKRLPQKFMFDAIKDIQVICPQHKGVLGTSNLNTVLQSHLNSAGHPIIGSALRVGDRCIQMVNNYDLDVSNGLIGTIVASDSESGSVSVDFDGRQVEYNVRLNIDQLSLAYAISVHRSQGSEMKCVVLPLHQNHSMMLKRSLLYTAVTRGKSLVIIVGSKVAIPMAIKNNSLAERHTALAEKLREEVGGK